MRNINEKYVSKNKILSNELLGKNKFVVLIIDLITGYIIDANQNAILYYGYSKEEFYELKIQDINVLNDNEVYEEMHKAETEKNDFFYDSHRLANGEVREVEVHNTVIKLDEQEVIQSIIYDVTQNSIQTTYLNNLFIKAPFAIIILDNDNNIVDLNNSFTKLFEFNKEDIINKNIKELVTNSKIVEDDIDDTLNKVNEGILVTKKSKRISESGKILHVEIQAFPSINHRNKSEKIVTFIDISDKLKKENELKLFEKVLSNNSEGIIITDKYGNIEWINSAFSKITGYTLAEVKKENPKILKSGKHNEEFYKNMWGSIIQNGNWQGKIYNKNKEGIIYPEFLSISSTKNKENDITNFIATFSDITECKIKEEKIWDLEYKDSLTGFYNRSFFTDKLHKKISLLKIETIAVLFLDLDDFKKINDTLGNSMGDRVLKEISERIQKNTRDEDIVARIGGNEFTILISDLENKRQAMQMANRIINDIKKSIVIDNKEVYSSASIGISICGKDGYDVEVLMKSAEIAMYKAKEKKGNHENRVIFFDSYMNKAIQEEFLLTNHIMNSLEKNEHFLVYQPIVDIYSNEIVGVEALLRWQNLDLGLISPDKFIPIAEKTGSINGIGTWVLKTACLQNKQWQLCGNKPIFISVNVSVIQLRQENFLDEVKNILYETKLDPKYLELEITESISMQNIKSIKKTIKDINDLGVAIVIDDFGTGYSSLAELNNMNISKLKIDKSFVDGIHNDSNSQKITTAIIAISKSLNIKVVAEGIEKEEQLSYLKDINCDYMQGYLFSKPVDSLILNQMIS